MLSVQQVWADCGGRRARFAGLPLPEGCRPYNIVAYGVCHGLDALRIAGSWPPGTWQPDGDELSRITLWLALRGGRLEPARPPADVAIRWFARSGAAMVFARTEEALAAAREWLKLHC